MRFAVRRERPEHKATTYFRIDSDVKASATIKVETPAQRTERNRRYAEQRRKVTRKRYWD